MFRSVRHNQAFFVNTPELKVAVPWEIAYAMEIGFMVWQLGCDTCQTLPIRWPNRCSKISGCPRDFIKNH